MLFFLPLSLAFYLRLARFSISFFSRQKLKSDKPHTDTHTQNILLASEFQNIVTVLGRAHKRSLGVLTNSFKMTQIAFSPSASVLKTIRTPTTTTPISSSSSSSSCSSSSRKICSVASVRRPRSSGSNRRRDLKINALTQDYDDNKDQFMKMVSSEGKMNALKSISAADQKLTSSSSGSSANNVISIDQSILKVDPYAKDALDMIGSRTKSTPVNFSVHYDTKWGENLFVLGSHKKLGAWDEAKAIPMHYKEGGQWSCEVELQPGGIFFYKYLVRSIFGTRWQEGANNLLVLPEANDLPKNATYLVEDCFNGGPTQLTRTNQTLLAAKLIETQKEKVLYAKELSKQQQMTKSALEELLIAREELAAAQMQLARAIGDGRSYDVDTTTTTATNNDTSSKEEEEKKSGFWSSR